ncbi:MAG: BlaI/MecI/CopY family transcriptional regulator [Planctomycetota bacterium]|nr:BlaI/MecI/CopY family transcriptional regulator [Planctomycetota bacterium]
MAIPSITEAEWQVMKVLWASSPMTSAALAEALSSTVDWKPTTIKTLVGRLVEKGAVSFVPRGREYLYSPQVAEADVVRSESGSFLTRCFDGSVAPMVAHFVQEHPLTSAEIARLREILDQASARDGGGHP